jgi:hypothetical protein
MAFNPWNGQYYEPDSYCIDPYQLPCSVYPTLKYNGGLFVSLLCDDNQSFEEKYPPGMRVKWIDHSTNMLLAGMVMDIPFPVSSLEADSQQSYVILLTMAPLLLCPSMKLLLSSLHHRAMLEFLTPRTISCLRSSV